MEEIPEGLAEQIEWQRQIWRREFFRNIARDSILPPARPNTETQVRVTRLADGTLQYVDVQGPILEIPPMAAQEDEITLLDDGDARVVTRPRPVFMPFADPEDNEEPVIPTVFHAPPILEPVQVDGIEEISMSQAAAAPKKRKAAVKAAPPIVEVERPAQYNGMPVYHRGQQLYILLGGGTRPLAYASFVCFSDSESHTPAVSMTMGHTPVLCATKADLAKFKELLTKVDITVAPGKTLCFFTGTEFGTDYNAENLVVIVFDGQTIRYGGMRSDERIMKLDSPICQKPEEIFRALTSFALRSTNGAENDIKVQKDMLARLAARNAEEAYLYINELTPPEDKAAVHARILSELEQTYVNDQRAIASSRAALAAAQLKIERAKSQLPSGRKGVPLRNSYLTSPILSRLLDYFRVIRNGNHLKVIFVYKKDLVVEGIEYGRPEIALNMDALVGDRGRARTFLMENRGVTVRSADKNAFMHPHIEGDRRFCVGTYAQPINNAIMGGNIPVAASLIWEYLSRYNPESPLINIETCRQQMAAARPRDLIIRRK